MAEDPYSLRAAVELTTLMLAGDDDGVAELQSEVLFDGRDRVLVTGLTVLCETLCLHLAKLMPLVRPDEDQAALLGGTLRSPERRERALELLQRIAVDWLREPDD